MVAVLPRQELLNALLKEFCPNVYFQPPSNIVMQYPCIRYIQDSTDTRHADNIPFVRRKRYQVTVIDADPLSEIAEKVAVLSSCEHDRTFTADSLNHFVFNLYF